jgi:hypothetical protein
MSSNKVAYLIGHESSVLHVHRQCTLVIECNVAHLIGRDS